MSERESDLAAFFTTPADSSDEKWISLDGNNIAQIRETLGISLEELSAKADIDGGDLGLVEHEHSKGIYLRSEAARRLADVLLWGREAKRNG